MTKSSPWNVSGRAVCHVRAAASEGGCDASTPVPDPGLPHPRPLSICCMWLVYKIAHGQALELCLRAFPGTGSMPGQCTGRLEAPRNECLQCQHPQPNPQAWGASGPWLAVPLLWGNSLPAIPSWTKLQLPTSVTSPVTALAFVVFLFLSHFPTSLHLLLSGITC